MDSVRLSIVVSNPLRRSLGVEIIYELYNPTITKIEVLKLERRLDENLAYLRDAPPEYCTFPFDMEPVKLPPGSGVPLNTIQVELSHYCLRRISSFEFRCRSPVPIGSTSGNDMIWKESLFPRYLAVFAKQLNAFLNHGDHGILWDSIERRSTMRIERISMKISRNTRKISLSSVSIVKKMWKSLEPDQKQQAERPSWTLPINRNGRTRLQQNRNHSVFASPAIMLMFDLSLGWFLTGKIKIADKLRFMRNAINRPNERLLDVRHQRSFDWRR